MRDYDDYGDDSIRLYTPVFQRVIILTAVIVAVPVMMWTITTFVRGYVARPKVPALERVATVIAPARAPATAVPSPAAPPDQPGSGAPSFSAPAPTATAPPVPPPPQMARTEILRAGEPIRGPIPLPRHRPGIFAMVASGPVPLPRARPGAVPAETSSPVTIPPYHFEPGMGINY